MNWNQVVRIAQELPCVEEGSYHGYPALRVRGKFLTRLGDDHKSLEFKGIDLNEGELLVASAPAIFQVPDEYRGRAVFARLSRLDSTTLRGMLQRRWRAVAPRALVHAYDSGQGKKREKT